MINLLIYNAAQIDIMHTVSTCPTQGPGLRAVMQQSETTHSLDSYFAVIVLLYCMYCFAVNDLI